MQQRLNEITLDWDKIYINGTNGKVFIFKDKKKTELIKIISIQKFKKLIKKVPTINLLITMWIP